MLNLELSVDQVDIVLAGLGELPLKVSLGVFVAVKGQADAQVAQQEVEQGVPAAAGAE